MSDPAHDQIRAATVDVRYDPEAERFEALHQGRPTGARLHAPRDEDGIWDLRSTQVPSELKGRGIAGALVRAALERVAQTEGDRVRPSCSYVGAWIRRHPAWMELVHPRFRAWLEPRAGSGPDEDGVGGDDDGGGDGSAGDGG